MLKPRDLNTYLRGKGKTWMSKYLGKHSIQNTISTKANFTYLSDSQGNLITKMGDYFRNKFTPPGKVYTSSNSGVTSRRQEKYIRKLSTSKRYLRDYYNFNHPKFDTLWKKTPERLGKVLHKASNKIRKSR